jgi:hypothetical protein
MIFGWFDASAAKQFGASLAQSFVDQVPLDTSADAKKFESKAKAAIKKLGLQVVDFKRQHALNGYQKARLCNNFKWTLKDAGYDTAYVDKLTDWLMLQL